MSDDEIIEAEVIEEPDPFAPVDRKRRPKGVVSECLSVGYIVLIKNYLKYPHYFLLAMLGFLLGLGMFLGLLDANTAGMAFILGIILVMSIYAIRDAIKDFVQLGPLGIIIVIAIAGFVSPNSIPPKPPLPPVPKPQVARGNQAQPTLDLKAVNTEALWTQTVVSRHVLRFGPPDQLKFKDLDEVRRFYGQQLADVQRVRSITQSSNNVAVDVQNLSLRLVQLDERELAWIKRGLDGIGDTNRPVSQKTFAEAITQIDEMTDEEWAQLPEEQRQWIMEIPELMEAKQALLSEVFDTQKWLRERYPTHEFPLPDISQDSGVSID
ncbi:hypothetical protein [Bremerella sp.]|uniref:hypothetical protein n=1 Tax=Bremerella sp. TaxID=2795602 RepID=UPI0039187660